MSLKNKMQEDHAELWQCSGPRGCHGFSLASTLAKGQNGHAGDGGNREGGGGITEGLDRPRGRVGAPVYSLVVVGHKDFQGKKTGPFGWKFCWGFR